MKHQHLLVYSVESFRRTTKDQLQHLHRYIVMLFLAITIPTSAKASITCKGHFVNPVTDVCWSCIMPISIGNYSIGKGNSPKKRDRANPKSLLCLCTKNNIPVPGVSIGFWEPVRLVDVTRTPYCMVNLGGIEFGSDKKKLSTFERGGDRRNTHTSFYHVHYYVYPLVYWLELLTDFACLESGTVDIAYISEFDISWNDPKLQSLMNPEAILFGNPIAQVSCSLDCGASTFNMPLEPMFWCGGCWGNIYPFSGANADHIGGVQNSSLLTYRIIAKMHRMGLAQSTATTDASLNGAICRKHRAFKIKKQQYKLQMVNPKSTKGSMGCWPLGMSDMLYSNWKEYPYDGQDWGYLIWRKKNCCFW